METQKPSVGRIVHFTLTNASGVTVVRPAIVVRVWEGPGANDALTGLPLVNLQVFTDGANDGVRNNASWDPAARPHNVLWRPYVRYDADGAPDTWRWPPRAP